MSFWKSLGKGIAKAASKVAGVIPVVGPYISDIADSMISDWESSEARSQQMSDSKAMMQYQNDINISNWQMQNEYNTPAAQLARYQDAGINPLSVGIDGGAAATPAAVSGQNAPDIASLLQYQIEAARAKQEIALTREQVQAQRIANKADAAEGAARIAEAHNRETEAKSLTRQYAKPSQTPPAGEGWQYNDEDNTWYRTVGNTMEILLNDSRVDDVVRARMSREISESDAANTAAALSEFNRQLTEKYGDTLQANTIRKLDEEILSASLQNRLNRIDVEFLENLGVGSGMARGILKLLPGIIRLLKAVSK